MKLPIVVHALSDIGKVHHTNEDSFGVLPDDEGGLLLLVCDGMGGMGRGDEASSLGVDVIMEHMARTSGPPAPRLTEAIQKADAAIRDSLCSGIVGRPGCTAASAYVVEGRAHVAWVGDSRVYLVRDGRVVSRTRDHKLVEALVESGELTPEEARQSMLSSVLTRALGGRKPSAPDVEVSILEEVWELQAGDRLLVSSDGLIDLVTDEEVGELVGRVPPDEAARQCIDTALSRGGHDNITVVVAEWLDEADAERATYARQRNEATPLQEDAARRAASARVEEEDDDPSSGGAVRDLLDAPVMPVKGAPATPRAAPARRTTPPAEPSLPPLLIVAVLLFAAVAAWAGVQVARTATLGPATASIVAH